MNSGKEEFWDAPPNEESETGVRPYNSSQESSSSPIRAVTFNMLFVNSGYGQWGGMPGNVLLAFSVDGK